MSDNKVSPTAETTSKKALIETAIPVEKVHFGFPVYAVAYSAATSTIFVAGGGGPAKSGVRNAIVRI
jgi:hypothetical protein